jgi:hypothetical protein
MKPILVQSDLRRDTVEAYYVFIAPVTGVFWQVLVLRTNGSLRYCRGPMEKSSAQKAVRAERNKLRYQHRQACKKWGIDPKSATKGTDRAHFGIGDKVKWSNKHPERLQYMVDTFGKGPFTIIGVEIFDEENIFAPGHPEHVTILCDGVGRKVAGSWFARCR